MDLLQRENDIGPAMEAETSRPALGMSLRPGAGGALPLASLWIGAAVFLLVWFAGGAGLLNLAAASASALGAVAVLRNFLRAEGRPEVTDWLSAVVWLLPALSLVALALLICTA